MRSSVGAALEPPSVASRFASVQVTKQKTKVQPMRPKLLMIDNYDSFTYNLVQYLGELGAELIVRRNDAIDVAGVRRRLNRQSKEVLHHTVPS